MIHLSFYFVKDGKGFPVLITTKGPFFLTNRPIPMKEFENRLKELISSRTTPTNVFGMELSRRGKCIEVKLPDGTSIQVSGEEFTKDLQHSLKNLSCILRKKPVTMNYLRFKLIRPMGFWRENEKMYIDEYDIEVYGDVYILNATVNLKEYLDELKELKKFIEKRKLPEEWRVVWDTTGPSNGLENELSTLKVLARDINPPFVRFTLGTYDPLEAVYASNLGDSVSLSFVNWAKITAKVPKEVLLKALEEAIEDAEKELRRLRSKSH
ncbi:hypothetical protein E3E26_08945 [Thermococcus sp. LS1]|uniref:hypothetical protein n=1 Tax=Thermococcus sp. LS1 TaxID=1638259 RepID=UPI001439962D|nr:hypothetical protein [Thermococcus sp. LS1]NJD99901.1 hypothetical protein [Thermococcus sp. LS1]